LHGLSAVQAASGDHRVHQIIAAHDLDLDVGGEDL
jgi:hypothetical protein